MEKLPLDFTEYLSQRLALPGPQVSSLLGQWLLHYEPVSSLGEEQSSVTNANLASSASLQATA